MGLFLLTIMQLGVCRPHPYSHLQDIFVSASLTAQELSGMIKTSNQAADYLANTPHCSYFKTKSEDHMI